MLSDIFSLDYEWPQISWSLFSILWSIYCLDDPLISKPSSPCTNPLVTVPSATITTGITVTFMFHSFFSSLASSMYLIAFFHFYSVVNGDSKAHNSASFLSFFFFCRCCCWLLQSLVVWPRFGDPFVCQNPRGVCESYSPRQILGCG